MTVDELIQSIRSLHMGFHLYTYGNDPKLFTFTLIDWEDVDWEDNYDKPDTLHALLTHAYAVALKRREILPVL